MREKGVDLKREVKKILVVDDEQNICVMLTKFLRSSVYSCESFTDPAKAGKRNFVAFKKISSDILKAWGATPPIPPRRYAAHNPGGCGVSLS